MIYVLYFILAITNALMDLSSQGKLKESLNMKNTWKRKWKNGDPKQGEKFFGSSTFLVWTTDFFHFVKGLFLINLLVLLSIESEDWKTFVILSIMWVVVFELTYKLCKTK